MKLNLNSSLLEVVILNEIKVAIRLTSQISELKKRFFNKMEKYIWNKFTNKIFTIHHLNNEIQLLKLKMIK